MREDNPIGEAPSTDRREVVAQALAGFLKRFSKSPLNENSDIFALGVVDSVNFIKLLAFIEAQFKVKILLSDFDLSNFRSIGALSRFIVARL